MADGCPNRYLIYELLRRHVELREPNGRKASGFVERVYRNVMEGFVEMTMGGKRMSFVEPAAIVQEGEEVVFVYGSLGELDESDEALFAEARLAGHAGESVDEVIRRTAPARKRETRFAMVPKPQTGTGRYARA
jgi:hypothetical protein